MACVAKIATAPCDVTFVAHSETHCARILAKGRHMGSCRVLMLLGGQRHERLPQSEYWWDRRLVAEAEYVWLEKRLSYRGIFQKVDST